MGLIWWEKTVEYYFVQKYCKEAIAPLDGKEESSWGDALLQSNGLFLLIEFKRNENTLKSEEGKFGDYNKAKKELSKLKGSNSHYLIYGEVETEFQLKAKKYFGGNDIEINDALNNGVSHADFKEYLDELAERRNKKTGQNDGGVETSSIAYICNVKDKEGCKTIIVLSESDFEGMQLSSESEKNNDSILDDLEPS